jgi:hypothetical protein
LSATTDRARNATTNAMIDAGRIGAGLTAEGWHGNRGATSAAPGRFEKGESQEAGASQRFSDDGPVGVD